jgi:hypothetical protein
MYIVKKGLTSFLMILFCGMCFVCAIQPDTAQEKNWIGDAAFSSHAGAWQTQDNKGNTVIVQGEMISKESDIISSGDYVEVIDNVNSIINFL